MKQYTVTGMSCAACSARVEKAVSSLEGVSVCSVNLLTGSMSVEGTVSPDAVIRAVEQAGYGASIKGVSYQDAKKDMFLDSETPKLKRRLCFSLFLMILLMYVSMGHSMWNLPLPSFFSLNPVMNGLLQFLLSALVLVMNQDFFVRGTKAVFRRVLCPRAVL